MIEFMSVTQSLSEEENKKNQEYILTSLALLLNSEFKNTIASWRRKYGINVNEWKDELGSSYISWAMKSSSNPPHWDYDSRVYSLCKKCHVNPRMFGNFVLEYLYKGRTEPVLENWFFAPWFLHHSVEDEYRFKSRVEVDYGEERPDEYTDDPQKVFLQVFKDTSKTGLINFIEKNWEKRIKPLQQSLKPYPHSRKFEHFKRDIQIFILSLLDNKPNEIAGIIGKENIPEEESEERTRLEDLYALDEDRIYDIIDNFRDHITSINE